MCIKYTHKHTRMHICRVKHKYKHAYMHVNQYVHEWLYICVYKRLYACAPSRKRNGARRSNTWVDYVKCCKEPWNLWENKWQEMLPVSVLIGSALKEKAILQTLKCWNAKPPCNLFSSFYHSLSRFLSHEECRLFKILNANLYFYSLSIKLMHQSVFLYRVQLSFNFF